MTAILGSLAVTLTGDTGTYGTAFEVAEATTKRAMGSIRRETALTERSIVSLHRTMGQPVRFSSLVAASRGFEGLNERANVLRGTILATTAIFGGFAAALGTNVVLRYADTYTQLTNRTRVVSATTADLASNLLAIRGAADNARAGLLSTATLFSRLTKAAPTQSANAVLGYVSTIQKALALGGATAEEAASAALQFSQAIASNRLGGDEFRAILETPLGLELAKGLGVTIGKLKEMSVAGQLTSDVVLGALAKIKPAIDKAFAGSTETLDQSLVKLDNALVVAIGSLNQTYGITKLLSGGVNALARNADQLVPTIATIAILLGTIFTSRLAGRGIGNLFGALASNSRAAKAGVDEIARSLAVYRAQQLAAAASVATFTAATQQANNAIHAPKSDKNEVLRARQAELDLQKRTAFLATQVAASRAAARNVTVGEIADTKKILSSKNAEAELDKDRIGRQAALARSYQQMASVTATLPAAAVTANEKLLATETRLAAMEATRVRIALELAAAHASLAQTPLITAASSPADVAQRRGAIAVFQGKTAELAKQEAQITAVTAQAAKQRTRVQQYEGEAQAKVLQQQAAIRRSIIVQEGALNDVYTRQATQNAATRMLSQQTEAAAVAKAAALKNKNYGDALKAGLQIAALEAQAGALSSKSAAAQAQAHAAGQRVVATSLAEAALNQRYFNTAVALGSTQLVAAQRGASVLGQGFSYLKAGARGLASVLGGPLGIALAAGLIGFEVYAAKAQEAAQAEEAWHQAGLRAANLPGVAGKSARQTVIEDRQKELDATKKQVEDVENLINRTFGGGPQRKGFQAPAAVRPEIAEARDQALSLFDAFKRGKASRDDVIQGLDAIGAKNARLAPLIATVTAEVRKLSDGYAKLKEDQEALQAGKEAAAADAISKTFRAAAGRATALDAMRKVTEDAIKASGGDDTARLSLLRVNGYEAEARALEELRKIQAAQKSSGGVIPDESALRFLESAQRIKIVAEDIASVSKALSDGNILDTKDFRERLVGLSQGLVTGQVSLQRFFAQAQQGSVSNAITDISSLTQQLIGGSLQFDAYKAKLAAIAIAQPDLSKMIRDLTATEDTAKSAGDQLLALSARARALDHSSVNIAINIATAGIENAGNKLKELYQDIRPQLATYKELRDALDETFAKRRGFEAAGDLGAKVEGAMQKIRAASAVPLFGNAEREFRNLITITELENGAIQSLSESLATKLNTTEFASKISALALQFDTGTISMSSFLSQVNKLNLNTGIQQVNTLTQELVKGEIKFDAYRFALARISADQPDLHQLIQGLQYSEDAAKKAAASLDQIAQRAARLDNTTVRIGVSIITNSFGAAKNFLEKMWDPLKAGTNAMVEANKELDIMRAKVEGFKTGGNPGAEAAGKLAQFVAENGMPLPQVYEALKKAYLEAAKLGEELRGDKKGENKNLRDLERTAEIIDRIKREGEGSFLGDIDRQVIEKTAKIKDAAILVRQYIDAIQSGDLSKAPRELLQVREALLQVGAADAYRDIIKNMGTAAQLTQTFADKQEQLNFLLQSGRINAGQYAQSWSEFVTSFGQYKWIDDVTSAFNQFGLSAVTDFKNIGDAANALKNQLINIILQTFVLTPLMQQLKNIMVGLFGPSMAGINIGGGGGGLAGGVANLIVGAAGQNTLASGGGPISNPAAAANIAGGGVAGQVWNFFKGKGLGDMDVAAIMGNIHQESGFNPTAIGPGGDTGLFQDMGSRKTALLDFIGGAKGLPDVNKQLEFGWNEMQGPEKAAFQRMLAAPDLASKTQAFMGFERPNPASAMLGNRQNAAEDYFKKFQGSADNLTPSLDSATKATDDLAESAATEVTPAVTDLTKTVAQVPPVATQAAAGTDQLTNSLGNQGGGLLGALKSFFGGGFNFGSNVGAPVTGTQGLYHGGGMAGFPDGTPRFHAGNAPNEFGAILLRGERVLTDRQQKRTMDVLSGFSSSSVHGREVLPPKIIINPPPGHQADARSQSSVDGYEVVIGFVSTATARGRFDSPNTARYGTKARKVS